MLSLPLNIAEVPRAVSAADFSARCSTCLARFKIPVILPAMWRTLLGLDAQTRAEKRAAINGMNLFFGALIGANLGSLERLHIKDYVLLILIVCLIVLYIQVAPVARNRWFYVLTLGAFVAGLYGLLLTPLGLEVFHDRPRPSPHLFVTICVWLISVATIELRPVTKNESPGSDRT